jgi:hypothetical protein
VRVLFFVVNAASVEHEVAVAAKRLAAVEARRRANVVVHHAHVAVAVLLWPNAWPQSPQKKRRSFK